ncbi:MAG: phytanoyl-CoA dioxygenase family protein [Saprospiraceae bacterium]
MFKFPKMLPVFKDSQLQAEFEENGFVTIPFYTPEEIERLTKLYHDLHPKDEKGFFPSTFSKDKNYRTTADREIRSMGQRSIGQYLKDYKVVGGSFIVKSPGPESIMNVHQDMTLVDESKYSGINIWCPLIDLNDKNGVLYILEKSHRIFPTYRGATIPDIYDKTREEIKQYMQPLFLKAGEAVIFDQSILHYSPPNLSDKIRIVTNIFFTHQDAAFRIAYFNKNEFKGQVELFEQDDNFMIDFEQFGHNIFDRPKIGKSLGLIDYDFPEITPELLQEKYGPLPKNTLQKPIKKSYFSKIMNLLKSN